MPRPSRCIHGPAIRIRIAHRARRFVRSVTVKVGGRRHRLGREPLRIRLRRPATRVTITVRARGGLRLRHTYTFRRC
jgi:hypothetical protein